MLEQAKQESEPKTFQQLYAESCQKAGELSYRIYMHRIELKKLNKHIKKLNIDAHREIQKNIAIQQAMADRERKPAMGELKAVPEMIDLQTSMPQDIA